MGMERILRLVFPFLIVFQCVRAEIANIDCVDTVSDAQFSGWAGGLRAESARDLPEEVNPGRFEGLEGFIYFSGRSSPSGRVTKGFDVIRGHPDPYLYVKYSVFSNNSASNLATRLGPITSDGDVTVLPQTENYEWKEVAYPLSSEALKRGFRPTIDSVNMDAGEYLLIDKLAIVYGDPGVPEDVGRICPGVFKVECYDQDFDQTFENGFYAATSEDLPENIRQNITGTGIYYATWERVSFQKILPLQQSAPAYVYIRFATYIGTFGGLSPMGSPAVDNEDSPFIRNIHFFNNKPPNYAWADEVFQYHTRFLGNQVYPLTLGGYERISGDNYFLVDKIAVVYGTPPDMANIWTLCGKI